MCLVAGPYGSLPISDVRTMKRSRDGILRKTTIKGNHLVDSIILKVDQDLQSGSGFIKA